MEMRPVRILIDRAPDHCLNRKEIKYTFETLFNLVGLPCHFVRDPGKREIDIHYGKTPSRESRLFIEMADMKRRNPEANEDDKGGEWGFPSI